jgi:hypothetical protein
MDQSAIDMALHMQRLEMIDKMLWFLEYGILYWEIEHRCGQIILDDIVIGKQNNHIDFPSSGVAS